MLVIIDNYDSFTYNIVRYFKELGEEVCCVRNDEISLNSLLALKPNRLVLSPGPCTPNEAGLCLSLIQQKWPIPILGICLGQQCLSQAFGGKVIRAKQVMHGKTSDITHNQQGIFKRMPTPFTATRYHSLILCPETLPECFEVTASVGDEIMAIAHQHLPYYGVQFHPESVLTEHGHVLFENFLKLTRPANHAKTEPLNPVALPIAT